MLFVDFELGLICPRGQGEGRGSLKNGQTGTRGERGSKKLPKCADILYGWPLKSKP